MPEKIVPLGEEVIRDQIKELVRGRIEETLSDLLETEAEKLPQAACYERHERRQRQQSVGDITESLWGSRASSATISGLNKKADISIEDWRNRPLQGGLRLYACVDRISCVTDGAERLKMWLFW